MHASPVRTCAQVMDKHLNILAKNHMETKIVRVSACVRTHAAARVGVAQGCAANTQSAAADRCRHCPPLRSTRRRARS